MSYMGEYEWQTRKNRIDKKLEELRWGIVKYSDKLQKESLTGHAVEEYPTANGPADYALFVKGKLLGIIEAKKVSTSPQNVLEQAKRYSRGAFDGSGRWNSYRVPFLYSTNGEVIHFADVRDERFVSRKISGFHTSDALAEFFSLERNYGWFKLNPVNIEGLRYYQKEAINKIEEAITGRKRAMLLGMATGTGKTFTVVAQIYRLLKSGVAKRILFLVDRKSLAAQAVRNFISFNTPGGNKFTGEYEIYSQKFQREDFDETEPFNPNVLPASYLISPGISHTFVYVSTIQRMAINLFGRNCLDFSGGDRENDQDGDKLDIPVHAFDVIIADECHRGYTSKESGVWRNVIEYFDAVKIGLTATPAPHSLTMFNEVIYRYTVEQAINDGFLVDYEAVSIKSDVRMKGAFLKEGEAVIKIDRETGTQIYDELEDERDFLSEDIEKDITVPECNRKIIEEIFKYALKHEEERGHFPKILIFAVNDLPHISHADRIVSLCREIFNRGDDFVQKITGSPTVDRPLQRIREFRNRPEPKVAVTVDMLSTGVDIPFIEFIVFLRPVKSRILWVQMLGRGTRLCPEINKTHFTIFDCFNGSLIEYFRNTNEFTIEPPQKEILSLEAVIEHIYQNNDRDYYTKVLVKRLHRISKELPGETIEQLASYIRDGDLSKFASELPKKIKDNFLNTMKILRDKNFQHLLCVYNRMNKTFLVGHEVRDEVSSAILFRVGDKYLKPADYLEEFSRFVRNHEDEIEALKILLSRPKEWRTDVLNQLRDKLSINRFPEKELQKAHKVVYNKALADIISMVKHAAESQEDILTAEERVERAVLKLMEKHSFDETQLKWIGFIRDHLIENLTIDIEDFNIIPLFERQGGLGKARKVFGGRFEEMIKEINYLIAA
ncbi:MAG: type I restriction-modification enzyme R subunit C-terminal domain-containing protein [Candidatus Eremiobacterota bacterium]